MAKRRTEKQRQEKWGGDLTAELFSPEKPEPPVIPEHRMATNLTEEVDFFEEPGTEDTA